MICSRGNSQLFRAFLLLTNDFIQYANRTKLSEMMKAFHEANRSIPEILKYLV